MNWERGLEGCVGLCRDRILIFAAERESLKVTDLRTLAVSTGSNSWIGKKWGK
jgi:hypothetical protein